MNKSQLCKWQACRNTRKFPIAKIVYKYLPPHFAGVLGSIIPEFLEAEWIAQIRVEIKLWYLPDLVALYYRNIGANGCPDNCSDVDPDPVGSGFIWVRGSGSGSGSRGINSLIK